MVQESNATMKRFVKRFEIKRICIEMKMKNEYLRWIEGWILLEENPNLLGVSAREEKAAAMDVGDSKRINQKGFVMPYILSSF